MTDQSDPRKLIRQLYREVDVFEIPREEELIVVGTKGSPVYGELTPAATGHLLNYLELGETDVFYDLGSGSGKVVLQAALTTPARKCVGIELAETRVAQARRVLAVARQRGLLKAKACGFRHEDILTTYLQDATVIYTCSTAFSHRFMNLVASRVAGLGRTLKFVTLQELDPDRRFIEEHTLRLDVSWTRRTPVYVYLVEP